jgi:hypothetical protein
VGVFDQASKKSYFKVRFTYWEDQAHNYPVYHEYTNWSMDLPGLSSDGFASTPTMELDLPEMEGLLDEKDFSVILPSDSFLEELSSGLPHEAVLMDIWEFTLASDPSQGGKELYLFRGQVLSTVRNKHGRNGMVELKGRLYKHVIDIPLGMPANVHCIWTLGQAPCQALVSAIHGFTIASITGKKVVVTENIPGTLAGYADYYFHRGFLRIQSGSGTEGNYQIGIREWRVANPTTFYTVRQLPQRWVGKGVAIAGGCDKTIETCRTRWNQEENFCGLGYAIPAYNPNFEE